MQTESNEPQAVRSKVSITKVILWMFFFIFLFLLIPFFGFRCGYRPKAAKI
jgi:hypothetical protein